MGENKNFWYDKYLEKDKGQFIDIISEGSSETAASASPAPDPGCTGDCKLFEIGRHDAIIDYSNKLQSDASDTELLNTYVTDYDEELLREIRKQTQAGVVAVYNMNDDLRKIDTDLRSHSSGHSSRHVVEAPVFKQKSFSDKFLPSRILKRRSSQKSLRKIFEEKATYCKPVLDMYNRTFISDMMERNARLQNLVLQLVREAQKRDKYKDALLEQEKSINVDKMKTCSETKGKCSCAEKTKKELNALSKLLLREVRRRAEGSSSASLLKSANAISEQSLKNQLLPSKTIRVRNQEISCDILKPRSIRSNSSLVITRKHKLTDSSEKGVQCKAKQGQPTIIKQKKIVSDPPPTQVDNRRNIINKNVFSEKVRTRNASNNLSNNKQNQQIHYKRYFQNESKSIGLDPMHPDNSQMNERTWTDNIGLVSMDSTPVSYMTYEFLLNHLKNIYNEQCRITPDQNSYSYDSVINNIDYKDQVTNCNKYLDSVNSEIHSSQSEASRGPYVPEEDEHYVNYAFQAGLRKNKSIILSCHSVLNKIQSQNRELNCKSCQESIDSEQSSQYSNASDAIIIPDHKDQQINCTIKSDLKENYMTIVTSRHSLSKLIEQRNRGMGCQASFTSELSSTHSDSSIEAPVKEKHCIVESDLKNNKSVMLSCHSVYNSLINKMQARNQSIHCKLQPKSIYRDSVMKDKLSKRVNNCTVESDLKSNKSVMMSCHSMLKSFINKMEPRNHGLNRKKYQKPINTDFGSKHYKKSRGASEPKKKRHNRSNVVESDLQNNKSVMISNQFLSKKMNHQLNWRACQNSFTSTMDLHQHTPDNGKMDGPLTCSIGTDLKNKNSAMMSCHSIVNSLINKIDQRNQGVSKTYKERIESSKNTKLSHDFQVESKNQEVNTTESALKNNKPSFISYNSVLNNIEPQDQIQNQTYRKPQELSFNRLITQLEKRIKEKDYDIQKESEPYVSNSFVSCDQYSNVHNSSFIDKQSSLDNEPSNVSEKFINQNPLQNCNMGKCILCNHFIGQNADHNNLHVEQSSLINKEDFENFEQISNNESNKLSSSLLTNQLENPVQDRNSIIEQSFLEFKQEAINNKESTVNHKSNKSSSYQFQSQYSYVERGSLNTQFSENVAANILTQDASSMCNKINQDGIDKQNSINIDKQNSINIDLNSTSSNNVEQQNQDINQPIKQERTREGANRTTNSLSYHFMFDNLQELNQEQNIQLQDSINVEQSLSNNLDITQKEENNDISQKPDNLKKSENVLSLEKIVQEHHEAISLILQKYDFFIKRDKENIQGLKTDHSCMTNENVKILPLCDSINDVTQTSNVFTDLRAQKCFEEKEVEAKEESEHLVKVQNPVTVDETKTRQISSKAFVIENTKLQSNIIEIRLVKDDANGIELITKGLSNIEKKVETLLESIDRFMTELKTKKSSKFFRNKKIFVNSEYNPTSLVNMATSVSVPFTKRVSVELVNHRLNDSSMSTVQTDSDSNATESKFIDNTQYNQLFKKINSLLEVVDAASLKSSIRSRRSSAKTTSVHHPDIAQAATHDKMLSPTTLQEKQITSILQESEMVNEKRPSGTNQIMNIAINTDPVGLMSLMKTMISYMPKVIKDYSFIRKSDPRMEPALENTLESEEVSADPEPEVSAPEPTNELIPKTKSKEPNTARSCLLHLNDECPFDCCPRDSTQTNIYLRVCHR